MNSNRVLSNGVEIPCIGMGTWPLNHKNLMEAVLSGIKCGYRAIDGARDYNNERCLGISLQTVYQKTEFKRSDLFITSKIGNGQQIKGIITRQIDETLRNIKTDYLDLWLMHWPYPGYYIETWQQMEKVYLSGKVRAIGVCNFRERHLKTLTEAHVSTLPMINQIEIHPLRTAKEEIAYFTSQSVLVEAYTPLGLMDKRLIESETLKLLSKRYNKTIPQIILRWHIQQGIIPLPKSGSSIRLKENIDIFDFSLTNDEILKIDCLNENHKLYPESKYCPGY